MKRIWLLCAALVIASLALPGRALAIGSFDASNMTVTPALVQFNIANLDRTNDGDHGGYDGVVIYSNIYCSDTDSIVAVAPNTTGPWNVGNVVSYTPGGYDGTAHTGCYARIYTNAGANDYQSSASFNIPTTTSPSLDPTFGTGGAVYTSFGANAYLSDVALQADGKVVAVGYASNGSNVDWKIARYHTNGSLDTSFGGSGIVSRDSGGTDAISTVAIQADGKIVVGGYLRPGSNSQWTVTRYNTDGTTDLGFGALGDATSFTSNSSNLLGLAIQPDSKVVAVGYSRGDGLVHDDIAVARYNPDGSADLSFGSGGMVTTGLNFGGTPNDRGKAVAIQADNKIVVFGDYDTGNHVDNVVLLRYNVNGSLDGSFGNGGIRTDSFQSHNGGSDVGLQADGKVVVTGGTFSGGVGDTYVARYDTSGNLDGSFGNGGKVITSFSSGTDAASALAVQPDGKILLAGYGVSGGNTQSAVRRFNANGGPDSSFGTAGSFVADLGTGSEGFGAIALQDDGRIVVGGSAENNGVSDWTLARLTEGPIIDEATLNASADTYVKSGQDNRNTGAGEFMRIRSDGDNRALVRFDQAAMQSAISGTVLEAKLRLTITDNGNNWGTAGRTVDVHRLLADWAEGNGTEADRGTGLGATWNCAIDSNIANQAKDCSGVNAWEMGQPNNPAVHPWVQSASDTQTITNGQTGVVEYDVTADVIAFLNGTSSNYGWILKKTDEGQPGLVSFGTRESTVVAQLVVTYEL